ncbi:nuclear receptor coactivator 5 [Caerostris darwini]|uniref:Nuclear receptor coactivator 5 n=1 Tax=Caerostris darwini TaxID=1538125 RepID=A0AAV4PA56_9ARAC|nr:nuclear receptor coactivator 5 [Caerostris darwini]
MSFRGRDSDSGNLTKMDLGESRRFGDGGMDDKSIEDPDERRFDTGRGRRPPFGRGRRPSPPGRDRPRDYNFGRDEPPLRDRSPLRRPDDRFSDRYKKDDGPYPKRDEGRKDMDRPFYGDDLHRDRYMDGGRSRFEGPGNYNSRFEGPVDQYKPRSMNYPSAPSPAKGYYNEGFPRPNECEIIVVNKLQRVYAESVEARIKEMGILVDVLFLKNEAVFTQTIDDIARRGSLYAMVISPQNEVHLSVTVNILHGTPQEHRNMPLDDALKLLSRNFHEYIRRQKEKMERERAERGPYTGAVAADRDMQVLLRMLADGRWISVVEIDSVIRYLSERRDKMKNNPAEDRGLGLAPLPPSDIKLDIPYKPKDDIDVAKKEQDLKNRIMNIMSQNAPPMGNSQAPDLRPNVPDMDIPSRSGPPAAGPGLRPPPGMVPSIPGIKSTPISQPSEETIPQQESKPARGESVNQPIYTNTTAGGKAPSDTSSTTTYINFDNPSVQKALDNLMQSGPSLLKNISLSGPNLSTPPPPLPESAKSIGGGPGMGPPNDLMGMQRSGMGPSRGPGRLPNMPGTGHPRSTLDTGSHRGPGNMDMGGPRGPGSMDMGGPRGPGNMDMGGPRGPGNMDMGGPRGPGNIDMGGPRGPGNMDMGGPRGPGNLDMSGSGGPGSLDMGGPRGPGHLDIGGARGPGNLDMGGPRGPGNLDIGGPRGGSFDMGPPRGSGNLDMGPPRGGANIGNIGTSGSLRGPGSSSLMGMGPGPQRGGFGDMGDINSNRGYGNSSMSDSGMDRGSEMGRMGAPPHGMGPGSNFPAQNQFGKYQGPGQHGSFPGSYNTPSMGNMQRQSYGGNQGMGGIGAPPRRY